MSLLSLYFWKIFSRVWNSRFALFCFRTFCLKIGRACEAHNDTFRYRTHTFPLGTQTSAAITNYRESTAEGTACSWAPCRKATARHFCLISQPPILSISASQPLRQDIVGFSSFKKITECIGVTLFSKIIQVSSIQLYNTSSIYCTVGSPLNVKSCSFTIYPPFGLFSLPPPPSLSLVRAMLLAVLSINTDNTVFT